MLAWMKIQRPWILSTSRPNTPSPRYGRPRIVFTHDKEPYFYGIGHREHLDFTAGIAVNALSHSDPKVARALFGQEKTVVQSRQLPLNDPAGELTEQSD